MSIMKGKKRENEIVKITQKNIQLSTVPVKFEKYL